jgi:glycosyltransferase involved in cell wall biosynthesis
MHFIDSGGLYGAESVLLNLSKEMVDGSKFEPVIGCIVGSGEEESELYDRAKELGFSAEKIIVRNKWLFWDVFRVVRQFRALGVDLIHSHGYKPSVIGFLVKLLSGIPVTATCHLWFLQGQIPLKMKLMIKLELFFYRFFPVVIAVSEPIRQTLLGYGISSEKVLVVNNGITLDDYREYEDDRKREIRAKLDLGENDCCLLNVGRLSRQKAQCNIISAAKKLKSVDPSLKYFIVGEGSLFDELQDQISCEGLQDTVGLLGFRDDIRDLLQVADVFLLPSRDEGMPIALLEAVASRVPVLVTAVGDVPKLISDSYSGVVVQVDNVDDLCRGICRLRESSSFSDEITQNAWLGLRKVYSSEAMYRAYSEIYNGLISS